MRGAVFQGTTLIDADLSGAIVIDARFAGANTDGAKRDGLIVTGEPPHGPFKTLK